VINIRHKRFKVTQSYPRVDVFLHECLPEMSRTSVAKLIKDNLVKLNDTPLLKKNMDLKEGDILEIALAQPDTDIIPYTPSFHINDIKLYEDDYLLIVDKPTGIAIHSGSGTKTETILDIFKYYYPQIADIDTDDPDQRPGIVHRLDRETSGLLILAKDKITMKRMQKRFKRREVHKTYLALVSGQVRFQNGTIDALITRSPKNRTRFCVADLDRKNTSAVRDSVTRYSRIIQFDHFALVKAFPITGRTHQIRVHFAHLGNPVLGDILYGKGKNFPRLALHSHALQFYHPITEQLITSYSPFPLIFREFLKENLAHI